MCERVAWNVLCNYFLHVFLHVEGESLGMNLRNVVVGWRAMWIQLTMVGMWFFPLPQKVCYAISQLWMVTLHTQLQMLVNTHCWLLHKALKTKRHKETTHRNVSVLNFRSLHNFCILKMEHKSACYWPHLTFVFHNATWSEHKHILHTMQVFYYSWMDYNGFWNAVCVCTLDVKWRLYVHTECLPLILYK